MAYIIVEGIELKQVDSNKSGDFYFARSDNGEHIKPLGLDYFYGFQDSPNGRLFQTQKVRGGDYKDWSYDKLLTFL